MAPITVHCASPECDKTFAFSNNGPGRAYCSRACWQKHYFKLNPDQAEKKSRRSAAAYQGELAKRREYRYLRDHGITVDDYEMRLIHQRGRCAICGTDDPGSTRWHIDHCHGSSVRRGLLCMACNVVIGALRDSPSIMQSAISYLSKWNEAATR